MIFIGEIDGGTEMKLGEILKVISGAYKVLCNGTEIEGAENLEEQKFVVESVSVSDGVICIQVTEHSLAPNDLNEKWVQEHAEKYGTLPNIFDGC